MKEVQASAKSKTAEHLADKHILITGGTGSFGKQIVAALLKMEPARVVIFSRDEEKQYSMRQSYRDHSELEFVVGDVRNKTRLSEALRGIQIVVNAAAMKQVPAAENAPYEAVLTNIQGAENLRLAATECRVETVISISTDKAVKPVNVMGMTKAIQERIFLNQSAMRGSSTRFVCVRYGNVLGSRGSVVPLFASLIREKKPLRITHPEMTRFLLTLPTAVELVFQSLVEGQDGDLWVRKMPASKVVNLATVLAYGITGREDYPTEIVGVRPGEKIHEVLISEEEMIRSREFGDYYVIHPSKQDPGNVALSAASEYRSDTVDHLSDDQLFAILQQDGWFGENK